MNDFRKGDTNQIFGGINAVIRTGQAIGLRRVGQPGSFPAWVMSSRIRLTTGLPVLGKRLFISCQICWREMRWYNVPAPALSSPYSEKAHSE